MASESRPDVIYTLIEQIKTIHSYSILKPLSLTQYHQAHQLFLTDISR